MDQGIVREGFGGEFYSRVQLRAVYTGVAVAVGILAVCLGLSWAIGLNTFEPTAERVHGLALGMMIWSAVAFVLSILAGAYVAALVGRSGEARDGMLHGLAVWGTLVAVLFLVFMSLFSGFMHDLIRITGADQPTGGELFRLDVGERSVIAKVAHDVAGLLWIYWAGIAGGFITAILGGWLGARAEHGALTRPTEAERPPIGPMLPHPTGT